MKNQTINFKKVLAFFALCCALVAGTFLIPGPAADAATKKTVISEIEMTIPVGKMTSSVFWNKNSWEIDGAKKLTVQNPIKGATYQYASSNSKVAAISKTGGYVTGVKAGSATITCTQTLNGKKTTVGKCKITVKNADLQTDDMNTFPVGSDSFDLANYYSSDFALYTIAYRNPNATYTFTSSSPDFTIKEVKYTSSKIKDVTNNKEYQSVLKSFLGNRYIYGYQFTAKKEGTYTITVKETLNKKSKTVGSFKVEIKATGIAQANVDIMLGEKYDVFGLLSYPKADTQYFFFINDYDEAAPENNALQLMNENGYLSLYGNKTGSAVVTIKEGTEDGTLIGTVSINVIEVPCQSISMDKEYTTYVGDYFYIYFELDPWETTDKVTIESDDPEVLKVSYDEESLTWIYTPLKVGKANVTVKCGNQTAVSTVIVDEW